MTITISPQPALTSTSTGKASIPLTAAEKTLDNTPNVFAELLTKRNPDFDVD